MKALAVIFLFVLGELCFLTDCLEEEKLDLVTEKKQKDCEQRYKYFKTKFICCGGYPRWVPPGRTVICCGSRPYIQGAQICCGGEIQSKSTNIRTIDGKNTIALRKCCARKQPYVYGKELCCNQEVVDSSKYGCCRNAKYQREFATCCSGVITPIFSLNSNVTFGCCGTTAYDVSQKICCNFQLFNFVDGSKEHTKCCKFFPYNDRTHTCCNMIREKKSGKDSCCHGRLMNSETHTCCNFKQQKLIYGKQNTGCCRSDNYKKGLPDHFDLYNLKTDLCCGGKLVSRAGENSSCCIQQSYDVTSQICCGGQVYDKAQSWCTKYRCCGKKMFCADKKICCAGQHKERYREIIYSMRRRGEEERARCCGWRKYDLTRFECRANNVLHRL